MTKRKSQQPTISLFSFQDIITSVTAILILIVLILSLELITRQVDAAASSTDTTRKNISATVSELQELVERLERTAAAATSASEANQQLAPTDADLQILRDQVDRVESQVAAASRVLEAAQAATSAAMQELHQAQLETPLVEEMEESADLTAAEASRLRQAIVEAKELLENDITDSTQQEKRVVDMVFTRNPNSNLRQWLVEVASNEIQCLMLGSEQLLRFQNEMTEGSPFSKWVAGLSKRDYALVIVRPSGVDGYQSICSMFEARQLPYGLDFIGEDQAVYDGTSPH